MKKKIPLLFSEAGETGLPRDVQVCPLVIVCVTLRLRFYNNTFEFWQKRLF